MKISEIKDTIKFNAREDLIKCIIYLKISEKNIKLSNNQLNVLVLFSKTDDKDEVIQSCIDNKYAKTWDSAENFVSKLTKTSLLKKTGSKKREINEEIFPNIKGELIYGSFIIHNLNDSN